MYSIKMRFLTIFGQIIEWSFDHEIQKKKLKINGCKNASDKFIIFYISHILYSIWTHNAHMLFKLPLCMRLSPNSFSPCQFVWLTIWYLAFITHLRLQFNQQRQQQQQMRSRGYFDRGTGERNLKLFRRRCRCWCCRDTL